MANLYQWLNISPIASTEEIETAYRKVKLTTTDKANVWIIDEVYLVLSNDEKRAKYDATIIEVINQYRLQQQKNNNHNDSTPKKVYINSRHQAKMNKMCSFSNALQLFFTRYFDFKGRSSRAEYWWWGGFNFFILGLLVPFIMGIIIGIVHHNSPNIEHISEKAERMYTIASYIMLGIPNFALQARRLHDTGRSGWWSLLFFTVIGNIWIIIWGCAASEEKINRYGKKPAFN